MVLGILVLAAVPAAQFAATAGSAGIAAPLAATARPTGPAGGAVSAGLAAASGASGVAAGPGGYRVEDHRIPVVDGHGGDQHVSLDATLYVPVGASTSRPVPAVVGAHGFGGDKDELRTTLALPLAERGYEVLLYSARGFGRTGGAIGLASPDYDVADARQLLDWLAGRPEVLRDGPGDPRVAFFGVSYGGGIALLTAALDRRVDVVVPVATWNSLVSAFDPGGVLKQQWAAAFFGTPPGAAGVCPPFVPPVCPAYLDTAAAGALSPQGRTVLAASSPAGLLARLRAPTLLAQGETDTLFPLNEAVATETALRAGGVPVKMAWMAGGHSASGPLTGDSHLRSLVRRWLDRWLRGEEATSTGPAFEWAGPGGRWQGAPALPAAGGRVLALTADGRLSDGAAGPAGPVALANPAGGQPAARSDLPGVAAAGNGFAGLGPYDLPGQHVSFESSPLSRALDVVGLPHLRFSLRSTSGEAVLFAKLYDVAPDGSAVLPGRAVAPVRVTASPGAAVAVDLDLAGLAHRFAAGHRLRLVLAATDQAYANLRRPEHYTVEVSPDSTLALPVGPPVSAGVLTWPRELAVALAMVAGAAGAFGLFRRRRLNRGVPDQPRPTAPVAAPRSSGLSPPTPAPLVLEGLTKRFGPAPRPWRQGTAPRPWRQGTGVLAVHDLSLRVEAGQVFGLLGPNGAGKTTTLRMALGLVHPSAGRAALFGSEVTPGAPVLGRVGALVEGPGFVPHLSGLDNLRLWWRAGGRPLAEADLEEALTVAGLGDAVHRRVRTYSHGMKQRLALAQAVLGRPELLVLDEPTDGLDPQQMREVRQLLVRLAGSGRTIVLSSHLLSEVEQICSHVAVMAQGRLVTAGTVDEIIGADRHVYVEVEDRVAAERALRRLLRPGSVRPDGSGLVVSLDGATRPEVVAALVEAGAGVRTVTVRRRLEDAFLGLLGEEA